MKFKRFPDALRKALPVLVRRSGWRGLGAKLPQADQASAEERGLWQELVAEVDAPDRFPWLTRLAQVGSWPGALRLASLLTGAVAAGWVLVAIAPSGRPPAPGAPIARGPGAGSFHRPPEGLAEPSVPARASERTLPIAPRKPTSDPKERTGRGDLAKVQGSGAPRSQQVRRGGLRKSGGNVNPSGSGRSPKGTAIAPQAVPNRLRPQMSQAPQQLVADAGLPPDEARSPLDPQASRSGAAGLCAALVALAPVPSGLEGFALVEVALGIDGALVEGEDSTRTLVSGGKQVDTFVLRSLQALTAGKLVGSGGQYSVALEAEKQRWSCAAAVEGLGHAPPEPGAG